MDSGNLPVRKRKTATTTTTAATSKPKKSKSSTTSTAATVANSSSSSSSNSVVSSNTASPEANAEANAEAITGSSLSNGLDLDSFLQMHRMPSGANTVTPTNTRISGGKYMIPDDEYDQFLDIYRRDVVMRPGKYDTLTEAQLAESGPCLIDLDFRFPLSCTERKFTSDHVDDLVGAYIQELMTMYQFDAESQFPIFFMEKAAPNPVAEKNVTKDGIHLIIGIQCDRRMQTILRRRMVDRLRDMWSNDDAFRSQTNAWADVLDESISLGRANWPLYGSGKVGGTPYKLTNIYNVGFYDGHFTLDIVRQVDAVMVATLLPKLSARHRGHPQFFFRSEFAREVVAEELPVSRRLAAPSQNENSNGGLDEVEGLYGFIMNIRDRESLQTTVDEFFRESIPKEYVRWHLIRKYIHLLPESYYGPGSYDKWFRVGMALRNIHHSLLILWIEMSAKLDTFSFSTDIPDMFERWQGYGRNTENGLSERSIAYWCRKDAGESITQQAKDEYEQDYVYQSVGMDDDDYVEDMKFDKTGTTDHDLALTLYQLFTDNYVCTSFTNNIWYKFEKHRWRKIDAGTQLRMEISNTLHLKYNICMNQLKQKLEHIIERDNPGDKYDKDCLQKKMKKLLAICTKCKQTSDKKNIMTESKELFFDKTESFIRNLDSNPYLLCFSNGVIDFKERVFREGRPDDYLTKCTNIKYVPINEERDGAIMQEIRQFMRELFPDRDIHDYMWEYLASTLVGVLPDQTWNMFIGDGQNGKSLLITIMGYILGDYKISVAPNLITDKRAKIGGTATEIVMLKSVRLVIMQEPQPDAEVNEGLMKQLTSGMDTIEGRGLYCAEMEVFKPQFKLVLASNYFMKIKSTDHGTWRRIRVVPFKSLFTANPVSTNHEKPHQFKIDYGLEERCKTWTEVFAAMLVEIAFRKQGKTTDCPSVLAASNAYRESQDYIAEFVSDRLVPDPNGSIRKPDLTREFSAWYEAAYGRSKAPSLKDVQSHLNKKFRWCPTNKVWMGVRIAETYAPEPGGFNTIDPALEENIVMEMYAPV